MNMNYKVRNNFVDRPGRLSRWNYCARKFKEFCERTDLHGFKYITMEGLSVAERSVWAVVVCISIICAVFLVVTAYRWYARNPIVTVVESTQGVIWDIPFPAVTICDLNTVSRKSALIFARGLSLPENVTANFVFKTLQFIPLLHSLNKADPDQKRDLRLLQEILDLNNISIDMLFRQVSPAAICSNLMDRCMWKNTIYHCNQIFRHVFVAVNLCCTFNYYGVDDFDNELKVFRFSTPRRVASCGYQTALTIITKTDPEDYYSTTFPSLGSVVFVDNAYNVPDLDSPMRVVNPSAELVIAVSAERTYATPGIKSFPVQARQCYYTDEFGKLFREEPARDSVVALSKINIPNFHQYSFHNCMALRKIALVKQICHCVPFYFPKRDRNRLCNFYDVECLETIMDMNTSLSSYENNGSGDDEHAENLITCLPECEHFSYPLQVALGTISDRIPLTGISFYKDVDLRNRSVVNVFFNDLVATTYRRDVYLNWQNVLAAFGGLLSLMLGFTVISVFDFVLFFFMRVLYDSVSRFFKDDKFQVIDHGQHGNIINVKEHRNDDWIRKSMNCKHCKHCNDTERKQPELFYAKNRY